MGETRVASDDYRAAITMYHFTAESGDDLELSHAVNVVTFLWFTQHVPHTAVWYHRVPPTKHLHCVATALVSHLCLPCWSNPTGAASDCRWGLWRQPAPCSPTCVRALVR